MSRVLSSLVGVCLVGCASGPQPKPRAPSEDLPAFHQVDEGLSRGGQPTPEGLHRLAAMGIKTVVNLRHHTRAMDWERSLAEELGMRWVNIPMYWFWRPTDRQIRQFLSIVDDPAHRPVFVHCRLGQNRAGVMVAIYRIVHDGWTPAQAYAEGRRLGLTPWNVLTHHLVFGRTLREFSGPRAIPGDDQTGS